MPSSCWRAAGPRPGALLAASVRGGRQAQADRDDLLARATAITDVKDVVDLDVPVLGCTLFALAVWEVAFGSGPAGSALLGYADRFAFNRMLPSFDRRWAASLTQPAEIPARPAAELRESVHAVLYTLRP